MRKKITLVCAALAAGLCVAQAEMKFNGFSMLDSPSQSTVQTLKSSGNNIYTFASFGTSTEDGTTASFLNGTFIGSDYTKTNPTSHNRNILLVKHDADGNILWDMTTTRGDFDVAKSNFVPTADGGALLALHSRTTGKNEFNDDIMFQVENSDGIKKQVTFKCSFWASQPVFAKIDNKGDVEWTKLAYCDTTARPDAKYYDYGTPDAFDLYDVAVDQSGCYYIVGRQKADFVIDGVTIPSHNNSEWDGDSQDAIGNAFILKLDEQGDYVKHITSTGNATQDQFKTAKIHNGKLYVAGIYSGKNVNIGLGGKDITPANETGMWAACLDLDLTTVEWVTGIPGVDRTVSSSGKNSIQLETMDFNTAGDRFYLGGGVQGDIIVNAEKTVTGGKMYNAFVVEVAVADGNVLNGVIAQSKSIGKSYGIVANSDSIYVQGYDWGRSNGGQIYLDSYDLNLNPVYQYALANNKSQPTAWGCAVVGDKMVAAFRGRYEFTFPGTDETYNKDYFQGGLLFLEFPGYDFDESNGGGTGTGVQKPSADNLMNVYSYDGLLTVTGVAGKEVSVYNVAGVCVARFIAMTDAETIGLDTGLYVVKAGSDCAKVQVR